MTANPQWPEVISALPERSHWTHHPDIVARVFNLKLMAMIGMIVKKRIFGEVEAYVYRIEWQARGMPHAHCLFILRNKLLSPRHIDKVVWAEIPCPLKYPVLHEIVCKRMIHDPCDLNAAALCLQKNGKGTCYRHFPKRLNNATTIIGDGYPEYRRRGRITSMRNGTHIDDRWVVPYNPYLLETFDAHINVEVAAHKRCFKYVYKYCFKAPDYATVVVDEIESYITGRLLSASEAVWRILSLKMHKEHPAVVRLDVHLPDHQNVIFDPTSDIRDIFEAAERSTSTLLEWFSLNNRDPSARIHLYTEIPEFYVWKNGTWMPRELKGCIAVGRMYNVSIHNSELFALRALLKCQRGCQNFSDLLMVDGYIHSTFRAACSALGMSHDDSEFIACFSEFVDTTVTSLESIRHQFAMMLSSIQTINARALFEHFAEDLCGNESRVEALRSIEIKMQQIGRSLLEKDFQFEDVPEDVCCHENQQSEGVNLPALTVEQCQALDEILALTVDVSASSSKVIAIVAPAGTGKTLFVRHAVLALKSRGRSSLCVAASCLAATLLPQGRTAHAALKIPINADDYSFCNWDNENRRRLASYDVIFWDEVSMVSRYIAETVDRSYKRLLDSDAMFGGKVFVFLGDFCQLPPVIRGGRGEMLSVINAEWFAQAKKFKFTKNFRSIDAQYSTLLEQIGNGLLQTVDIPPSCIAGTLDDAIRGVYGNEITSDRNASSMMLAFTLEQCSITNDAVLDKISGSAVMSDAADDLSECKSPDEYPPEYVSSLHIHGSPPAVLKLKIGARYMIMRNLSPPVVCNGVLAVLIGCTRLLCSMHLISGPGVGQVVKIPRVSIHVTSENSGLPFNFVRRQFPITPAYCVTVHKSQGQTLSRIGIIADTDAFAHGLVYVALSRVGKWADVTFYSPRNESYLINKVYRHMVQSA